MVAFIAKKADNFSSQAVLQMLHHGKVRDVLISCRRGPGPVLGHPDPAFCRQQVKGALSQRQVIHCKRTFNLGFSGFCFSSEAYCFRQIQSCLNESTLFLEFKHLLAEC